jgi:hypothetical protein
VRSDLFGPGDAGEPENADELEEMLANEQASNEDAAAQSEVHRQATDTATWANDTGTGQTVVIEDRLYVPPVD